MRTFHTLLCVASACAVPVANAQSPGAVDAEAPPRYNVEIIVFANNDVDPGEERYKLDTAAGSKRNAVFTDRSPPPDAIVAIEPLTAQTGEDPGAPASRAAADAAFSANAQGGVDAAANAPAAAAADPLEFLQPFGDGATAGVRFGPTTRRWFRLLRPDELQLGDARRIIDRLGAYRLLGHGGWQQDGLDQSDAIDFDVANLGMTNPTGTIQVSLRRYLRVSVDLDYRLPPGLRVATTSAPAGSQPGRAAETLPGGAGGPVPGRSSPLEQFRIPDRLHFEAERNAIRSGELHYIDHPLFGILVLITPAPAVDDDAESLATDQPAA